MKKAAAIGAVAVTALALTGHAGARATFETDVDIIDITQLKNGEILITGGVFSEKAKCRGGRKLELISFDVPEKRHGRPVPIDTGTSSKRGGFGFLVDPEELTQEAVKVRVRKATKGDDTCAKDSDFEFLN